MGWLISIALLFIWFITGGEKDIILISSGVFAVSGSISIWLHEISKKISDIKEKNYEEN